MKKFLFLGMICVGLGINAQNKVDSISFTYDEITYHNGDSISVQVDAEEEKGERAYEFRGLSIKNESTGLLSQVGVELSYVDTLGFYASTICTDQCTEGLVGHPIDLDPAASFDGLSVHLKFIDTYHTSEAYAVYDLKIGIDRTDTATLRIRFTPNPTEFINDVEVSTMLRAYPNPATDQVTIAYSIQQPAIFGIYDIQGRNVMQQTLNAGEQSIVISTKALPRGLYLYRILSDSGSTPAQKLMVR